MRTFEEIKNIIETGLGRTPCDTKLENVMLVNVFSEPLLVWTILSLSL